MLPAILFFPMWMIVFLALLFVFLFVFWIYAVVHCLSSRLNAPEKLMWLIVVILFNVIGALLYFIFSRQSEVKMAKAKNLKGKKFFRSSKNRMIAGVCGGIGEYLEIDPTVVRLIWVLLVFLSFGAAILAYIIAWIIVPEGK